MKKSIKKAKDAAVQTNAVQVETAGEGTGAVVPFVSMSMNLSVDLIDPSPYNPRTEFKDKELEELAESIRLHGVQTDIKVRPAEGGRYQIVYGERRYRASLLAGRQTIPAKVECMTDEQAETCAIIENMQRENFSPFEEGKIFRDKYDSGRTIAWICETYGKKEEYVRGRMNLTKLIPEVAALLKQKEITLEVAKEFAKYDQQIQSEVYGQHFHTDGFYSWKGIAAKELAKRLYERYMTKLDSYNFDKGDCAACGHNTFNQVLFTECGDCPGCSNMECLMKKNTDYLVNRCIELSGKDPRLHIAIDSDGDAKAAEILEGKGYEVTTFDAPYWRYTREPDMPQAPDPADYDDQDDLQFAMDDYNGELEEFKEATTELEFNVSEGRMLKYAVIKGKEVRIIYDKVEEESEDDSAGEVFIRQPESPAKALKKKDERNGEICCEHITKDLKKLLYDNTQDSFPQTEMTERERQFLYYVLLEDISGYNREKLGIEGYGRYDDKRLEAAERLTPEQKTMLYRMAIMRYCENMSENYVKPDSPDIRLFTEFMELHYPEESRAIQEKHKKIYEKRHANLQVRIEAIEDEAELLRLKKDAEEAGSAIVEFKGRLIDIETGELKGFAITQPDGFDYPQPVDPQEPAPQQEWPAGDYTDRFIPDEPSEIFELVAAKASSVKLKRLHIKKAS